MASNSEVSQSVAVIELDTACPLDCPDGCSLTVKVQAGRLIAVDATPIERAANPLTAGFICQKVKHHGERVHGNDRILTPLVRTGAKGIGEFRPATWDEALDLVADRMREAIAQHGARSVLPYIYNSSAGVLAANVYGDRVGAELGLASLDHTICAATNGVAKQLVLGGLMSTDPLDLAFAKHIVIWGANPTISNTHLPPLITRAVKEGGAKLVVIDPRRTAMAARADRHLALRIGTDAVLAAGVARHLQSTGLLDSAFIAAHSAGADEFLAACDRWTLERAAEVTGLGAREIAEFAEEWATTRPSTLRIGWGMERNFNGGSGTMSALALPVLMGHFGVRGAGILHSTGSGNGIDVSALTTAEVTGGTPPPARRSISQNDLALVLNSDDPADKIRVLIVQGANPALMNLDQNGVIAGLKRDDVFTVVHEQVLTDTCRYADVVFPATTHFEAGDLVASYGSFVVQQFPAVIERVGESRTNSEFFADLGQRFDLDLDADPVVMAAALTTSRPFGEPKTPGSTIQMVDVFPGHDDQRFHLIAPSFETVPTTAEFPLTLLSPSSNKLINSMFGERYLDAPTVQLHPVDAAARSIVDGQKVRVFNDGGTLTLTVKVTTDVREGIVVIPKGFWSRAFGNDGFALNALIPRRVEPLAGGACFNDAHVQVERFEAAA